MADATERDDENLLRSIESVMRERRLASAVTK